MKTIDLRSDTVTKPTSAMREAMASAEVGDDVYGDDPTINMLEDYVAERMGFEAALFTASGTAANLLGLLSHCERGDEYIVGGEAHTYKYEGGGAAVLGSIQPQPIEFEADSTLDLAKVEKKIKPNDFHYARTKLLCLENTQNGKVLPLEYLAKAREFCLKKNLQLHLDGARICNAAVAQGVDLDQICQYFDSATICLSKGLGAPVGSLLCGKADFIAKARRWRKVTGGAMRQAGILAAAGLYALEHQFDRLAEDHENASYLATELAGIDGCAVTECNTNMLFVEFDGRFDHLQDKLARENILISQGVTTRLVCHIDTSREDLERLVAAIKRHS